MNLTLARNALTVLAADLRSRAGAEPALIPFAERLEEAGGGPARLGRAEPLDHPAMAHLPPALAAAQGAPEVVAAARAVAQAVNWYQIYRGPGADPELAQGMLAGQIVGQAGLISGDRVRTGLFLLAPGIHYPRHTHGAGEVYYCLSGALTLTHGLAGAPFELTPGRLSVTPPNRLHGLTTGAAPVLLFYIWTGAVDAPNWWWEQAPDGGWLRACWTRQPDDSWAKSGAERVSPAAMAEADC